LTLRLCVAKLIAPFLIFSVLNCKFFSHSRQAQQQFDIIITPSVATGQAYQVGLNPQDVVAVKQFFNQSLVLKTNVLLCHNYMYENYSPIPF